MEDGDILKPGINIKPIVTLEEIKEIVYTIYGFKILKITQLNGYDDKNYHIIVENNERNNKICENGYVLKIINSLDSMNPKFFEAQTKALFHLGRKGILCPKPIPTKGNLYFIKTELVSGEHIVRILEFISGSILTTVTCTPKLLYQIGQYAAKLDQSLQGRSVPTNQVPYIQNIIESMETQNESDAVYTDFPKTFDKAHHPTLFKQLVDVIVLGSLLGWDFNHPAYDTRKTLWTLEAVPQLRTFIFAIVDETKKNMVLEIIDQFETRVLPLANTLERGLIHGDINEQNIIVDNQNGICKLKTVIDFGDSHMSCYIFELAITMMYIILNSNHIDTGGYVLAGYSSIREIPDVEFGLIKICIMARLCQSLVLGAYSFLQNPENSYVMETSTNGWILLEKIWKYPEAELLKKWKTISETI